MKSGEVIDFGDAPEHFIRGIGSVTRIGQSTVKLGWYAIVDGERKIVLCTYWDFGELMLAYKHLLEMLPCIGEDRHVNRSIKRAAPAH